MSDMMTRGEALQKCKEHWRWLADTGGKLRSEYFEIKGIHSKEWPLNECYCCEYDTQFTAEGEVDCPHCPLTGYAWSSSSCLSREVSIFDAWFCSTTSHERSFWALKMVEACDRALNDEPKVFTE